MEGPHVGSFFLIMFDSKEGSGEFLRFYVVFSTSVLWCIVFLVLAVLIHEPKKRWKIMDPIEKHCITAMFTVMFGKYWWVGAIIVVLAIALFG